MNEYTFTEINHSHTSKLINIQEALQWSPWTCRPFLAHAYNVSWQLIRTKEANKFSMLYLLEAMHSLHPEAWDIEILPQLPTGRCRRLAFMIAEKQGRPYKRRGNHDNFSRQNKQDTAVKELQTELGERNQYRTKNRKQLQQASNQVY